MTGEVHWFPPMMVLLCALVFLVAGWLSFHGHGHGHGHGHTRKTSP